jgi:hypothetical protein
VNNSSQNDLVEPDNLEATDSSRQSNTRDQIRSDARRRIVSQYTNDQPESEQVQGRPNTRDTDVPPTASSQNDWHAAKHIIRQRTRGGELEFLIRFQDGSACWCRDKDVTDELKKRYFLKQAQLRSKQRRTARQKFKDT